ncbi:methionine aminopeptidase, type I [Clostridium amylolyticum]|uniref:Methionine aminopeptidase n=1 Tax=Clostridium amylolyticum TaxID=1121298 RepID=A0A1M6EQR1_9CLOT|nr:type I methionyl aminopeptidase [Clostridium amylolyticum]SHI87659.1 methionine aminopeptidase, type I [Clostridium amylolyticum]
MIIQNESEFEALKKIGTVVAIAREEMLKAVKPGVTTKELDMIAKEVLDSYGAKSAPITEYNYPGYTCISINDEVAHGIPGGRVIREGDLVNVDVSAVLDGFYSDTGATIIAGESPAVVKKLLKCSEDALYKGIAKAKAGSKVNQIGRAIFNEARNNGFTVIRDLTGHGIGKKLHDEPQYIFNYYNKENDELMVNGMVLAIETFISTKAEHIEELEDGWTLVTPDGSWVSQFEHTVVVHNNEPIILTAI